ncbi:MAG: TSUP family transporter [Polyangiales bacterium]|jgi:hypothetical protein
MAPGSRSLDPYHIEPSGIGGAVFFSPIFILWLKLDPTVAVGVALVTEFFGFSSGLIAYVRAKLIDYRLGGQLLVLRVACPTSATRVAPDRDRSRIRLSGG